MITGPMRSISFTAVIISYLLLLNSAVAVEQGFMRLMSKLAAKPERQASFIEERHAFYLDTPLKSQGHLKASPPGRLEKTIIVPESIQQVINGDRITHSKNGKIVREMSLSQQPVLAAAINTMRSVLFGDVNYLQKYFQIRYEVDQQKWQLHLVPREKQVVKYIKSIIVSGAEDRISEFLITETNGDYSRTRLYEAQK